MNKLSWMKSWIIKKALKFKSKIFNMKERESNNKRKRNQNYKKPKEN